MNLRIQTERQRMECRGWGTDVDLWGHVSLLYRSTPQRRRRRRCQKTFPSIHSSTHTHIHKRTQAHTYLHTVTNTYMLTHKSHTHAHTHTNTHLRIQTYTHICAHTLTHTRAPASTHACIYCTYIYVITITKSLDCTQMFNQCRSQLN